MGVYSNMSAKDQEALRTQRLRAEKMLQDMNLDRREAARSAAEYERDSLKDRLEIMSEVRDLLVSPDPDKQARGQAITAIFKAMQENAPEALKAELSEIDEDLAELGFNPDGTVSDTWGSGSDQTLRTTLIRQYRGRGTDALVDYLTSDDFVDVAGPRFKTGGKFSDLHIDEMLRFAGFPLLDEGKDSVMRAIRSKLTQEQAKKAEEIIIPALASRRARREAAQDLFDNRSVFASAVGKNLSPGETYALAVRMAEGIFPKPVTQFASPEELLASLGEFAENTSCLAQQTGRSAVDLFNDPTVSDQMFGSGASYVSALRGARNKMATDRGFRLWLQDRGIKLPEGAMPSPFLANRYLRAKEGGWTGRMSKRPQGTGQTLTYTVRAGKEYNIGATGRGGAPLYAVGADGEYLTAAQLSDLSDRALPEASVIMARLGDVKRGQPLSAISALVAPAEKEQFERELIAILNDEDKVGDARILVDKNTKTIQVVNRLGKVLQVHTPDKAAFDGAFASLSKQPDLFSVAGSAAALSTGRGGNALVELNPKAEVGSMLEGGIGVAIPEGIRLDATEPTITFTDRSRRFFASQDPDVLHTMSGREINVADVVSIEDAATGEPVDGAVSDEAGQVGASEPSRLQQFSDTARAKGVRRRYKRHRRGFDAPVDHTVSRLDADGVAAPIMDGGGDPVPVDSPMSPQQTTAPDEGSISAEQAPEQGAEKDSGSGAAKASPEPRAPSPAVGGNAQGRRKSGSQQGNSLMDSLNRLTGQSQSEYEPLPDDALAGLYNRRNIFYRSTIPRGTPHE